MIGEAAVRRHTRRGRAGNLDLIASAKSVVDKPPGAVDDTLSSSGEGAR
jgi:hypothetical protein